MIIINRHNYEEYFLLYTDNELDAAEKKAVEEFVQQHPDLKIELEMLQQTTLHAEPIVFHSKDVLLKNSSSLVNETNYEEYFVLYGDDELDNEQKDIVEQFVYRNSQYQAEFELIQQVKFQAERHIVFPDKDMLYRTEEEEENVFVFRWWKIVAAAIFLIFLTGLGWMITLKEKSAPATSKITPQKKIQQPEVQVQVPKQENTTQAKTETPDLIVSENKKPVRINDRPSSNFVRKEDDRSIPQLLTEIEKDNKNVGGRNIQVGTIVSIERPEVKREKMETTATISLQNDKKVVDEAVEPAVMNEYAYTTSNEEIEILNTTVSKKNKLRGLFRKVTRVVEKTTSIETGNGRGIRIGNIEIALK